MIYFYLMLFFFGICENFTYKALNQINFNIDKLTFRMIEEYKEGPVNEPCALLEGLKGRRGQVALNKFLQAIKILQGIFPVLG